MKDGLIVSKRLLSQARSLRPEIMWAVLITETSKEVIYKEYLASAQEGMRSSAVEVLGRNNHLHTGID